MVALIKAGWLELNAIGHPAKSGHNSLSGQIEAISEDEDGPSEVRIALPNGQTLCALAPPEQIKNLGLSVGSPVQTVFAPSMVILGTPL